MKEILYYSLTMGISLHIQNISNVYSLPQPVCYSCLTWVFASCFLLGSSGVCVVQGKVVILEALPISSSMWTISILLYPEMFCVRGLEDLFLPLSPA